MAKIMIIDDDVEFAENISVILKKNGHSIGIHDHTEDMIEELVRNTPDLLILDVMFPENPAGGFDLARKIRNNEKIKALPIILLTGVNQEFPMDFSANDIDPEWMPVQNFVEKPVDIEKLLGEIQELLEGSKK